MNKRYSSTLFLAALALAVMPATSRAQYTFPQDVNPAESPTGDPCPNCLSTSASFKLTWTLYFDRNGTPLAWIPPAPATVPSGSTVDYIKLESGTQTNLQVSALQIDHLGARSILPLNGASVGYPFTGLNAAGIWNLSVWLNSVSANGGSLVVTLGVYYHYTPPPPPDYAVNISPKAASTGQGMNSTYTVAVTPLNGFSASVNVLGVENVPLNAAWNVGSWTISAPSWSTTLTLSANTAALGTYYPVIHTGSGSLDKRNSFAWTIAPVAVTISPANALLANRQTLQFTATVTYAINTTVTWSVREGAAGGTVSSTGLYTPPLAEGTYHVIATSVADGSKSAAAAVVVYDPGTFTATGSMLQARAGHTATLLPNGNVLLAGGYSNTAIASWELFSPAAGTFSSTAGTGRKLHTATLLSNGKVLILGGVSYAAGEPCAGLYDPGTGSFSDTGIRCDQVFVYAPVRHTATLLKNGKVLVAGGVTNTVEKRAWLYDPATGSLSETGTMSVPRRSHSATLLPDGNVLIAGGWGGGGGGGALDSAEIYRVDSGTFRSTAAMKTKRGSDHTATLLANGKVLIAGGFQESGAIATAELFDPDPLNEGFAWTRSMSQARTGHTATLQPNGNVLVMGSAGSDSLSSSEVYNPTMGSFGPGPNMIAQHGSGHSAVLLANGEVLVAGGATGSVQLPCDWSTNPYCCISSCYSTTYTNSAELLLH